jgi:hypothetical protein
MAYPLKLFKTLILALLLLMVLPAVSQRKVIEGLIRDSHSDEPVPFASVNFRGTTVGKLSDSSGHFLFNLGNWLADTLEITCVGYQPFFWIIDKKTGLLVC